MWLGESAFRFAAKALLLYIAIVLPATLARGAYSSAYRAAANTVLYALGLSDRAALRVHDEPDGTVDTRIVLFDKASGAFVRRSVTPWRQGFLPTAALVALVLATKLPWRRRLRALLIGLIAINLFIGLRLGINFLTGMNGGAPWCIMTLGPTATSILGTIERVFVHTETFAYAVAALIWLAVTWPLTTSGAESPTGRGRRA